MLQINRPLSKLKFPMVFSSEFPKSSPNRCRTSPIIFQQSASNLFQESFRRGQRVDYCSSSTAGTRIAMSGWYLAPMQRVGIARAGFRPRPTYSCVARTALPVPLSSVLVAKCSSVNDLAQLRHNGWGFHSKAFMASLFRKFCWTVGVRVTAAFGFTVMYVSTFLANFLFIVTPPFPSRAPSPPSLHPSHSRYHFNRVFCKVFFLCLPVHTKCHKHCRHRHRDPGCDARFFREGK